jgi:hypothetical protein
MGDVLPPKSGGPAGGRGDAAESAPHDHGGWGGPRCCPRCFGSEELQALAASGGAEGPCGICEAPEGPTTDVGDILNVLLPFVDDYEEVTAGVHYIPELSDPWDIGEALDVLVEDDHPDFFGEQLDRNARARLLNAILDARDNPDPTDGYTRYDVLGDPWVRPGHRLAQEDEWWEVYWTRPPARWSEFVRRIKTERRFVRPSGTDEVDPRSYLAPALLNTLVRLVPEGTLLYRAAVGGVGDAEDRRAYPPERMAGPKPEQCREGGRVNPPWIPMLYTSDTVATVVAEVRPHTGAAVSVATMRAKRNLRLVDFSPRTNAAFVAVGSSFSSQTDVDLVLDTIGAEMARPVDPSESVVDYVPTQYVAEVVRAAEFDGVAYKSAVGPDSNLVLFNLTDAEVVVVDLYQVTGVRYDFEPHRPAPF